MEYVNQIFIPIDAEDRVDEEHQVRAGSVADPNQIFSDSATRFFPTRIRILPTVVLSDVCDCLKLSDNNFR